VGCQPSSQNLPEEENNEKKISEEVKKLIEENKIDFVPPEHVISSVYNIYEPGKILGEGSVGKVFIGIDKQTLKQYAIKTMLKNQ